MAWIRQVGEEEAEGRIAKIYKSALERAGKVFGILKIMSLDPAMLQASMGLYTATTMSPRGPLPRWFRELIAVTVSRLNDCYY